MTALNVYLAGKVNEDGAWRDALLGRASDRVHPRWELAYKTPEDMWDLVRMPSWPTAPNRYVLNLHNYVGPYRTTFIPEPDAKNVGYFHGSTGAGQHGMPDDEFQDYIVTECTSALRRADIVFAYINRPDCFGTIAEIGMAKALGKYVAVITTPDAKWEWRDYWFAGGLADVGHSLDVSSDIIGAEEVRALFRDVLVQWTTYNRPSPVAILKPGDTVVTEVSRSFAQIARWTSDPRVRNEARAMLRRLGTA